MTLPSAISGLSLWLRASDITGLVDGDVVATWTDSQSGSGLSATQVTASMQPIYKTAIMGGQPVVRFDGVDDVMTTTGPTVAQPDTIIAVFTMNTTDTGNYIYDGIVSTSRQLTSISATPGQLQTFAGTVVATFTPIATTPQVYGVVFSGASSSWSRDGSVPATISPGTEGITGLTVGNRYVTSGASNLTGDIAEIIVYNRALTTTERAQIDSYVQDTYGITVADYLASGTAYTATPADAEGLTDSAAAALAAARTLADAEAVTDTAAPVQALDRTASDPAGITDGTALIADLIRAPADPEGVTDTASTAATGSRSADDPVGITDAATIAVTSSSGAADPLGLTDAVSVVLSRVVTAADLLGLIDRVNSGAPFIIPTQTVAITAYPASQTVALIAYPASQTVAITARQ